MPTFPHTAAYKIASFEITHLPLIKYVAKTLKPIIISTRLANLDEGTQAFETARDIGCKELAILHCDSVYPAPVDQMNLAITSVAMGASFIEKHETLSQVHKGPDSEFSLEPAELKSRLHRRQHCMAGLTIWRTFWVYVAE